MDFDGLSPELIELHKPQLEKSGVPEHFWKCLFSKLIGQVYDAGDYFQVNQIILTDGGDTTWEVAVIKEDGMSAEDSNNIFLIDHAWTYEARHARQHLMTYEGLADRMAKLMNISFDPDTDSLEKITEDVLKEMWKYNNTYSLGGENVGEQLHVWYIMDEFGSKIDHSDEPNFRTVPFYYHPHKCCYTLLFIIKDVLEGDEVYRDFAEGPPVDDITREAQLLPWKFEDFTHYDYKQIEPLEEFFTSSRMKETLPDDSIEVQPINQESSIKVYSDYEYIRDYLTDNRFVIVDNIEEADIIWLSTHYKDFKQLRSTPTKRINQFPMEHLITVKDLLAVVCRRSDSESCSNDDQILKSSGPDWLPITFCLKRELVQFVSYFQQRQKLGLDNHWIIKPWNLARGLDLTVTNNINHIVRLPSTGPKIAQKYIEDPVLFWREDINAKVKFDLRFIVMLLDVKPLRVAVYKRFWIRFGNKEFGLSDLDDYEKHFTVNNYNDKYLLQMFCHDFIKKFEEQYRDYNWRDVENNIYKMIKEIFTGATKHDSPKGISDNKQCKGSYGLDIMINWSTNSKGEKIIVPKLLEVNFNSDCKRACEYYPEFFNDLFCVMFLDEVENHNVALL